MPTRVKTGGRAKGTPNRASAERRAAAAGAVDRDLSTPIKHAREAGGLAIRYLPLDGLLPYDRNARTHTPAQISAIERSLVEFGWTAPMAIAGGMLIYGHARREAARNLRNRGVGIPRNPDPDRGPVVDLSHLNAAQRRAHVLADNQLATLAGWNDELYQRP
jgi:ParB-like chromosome segregation protein Spo0J